MDELTNDVSWLAVAVGAVVSFLVGWLWYSPKLFGPKWAEGVCRRAERAVIALAESQTVARSVVIYMNRLSDLLFAFAREANRAAGCDDIPWETPD